MWTIALAKDSGNGRALSASWSAPLARESQANRMLADSGRLSTSAASQRLPDGRVQPPRGMGRLAAGVLGSVVFKVPPPLADLWCASSSVFVRLQMVLGACCALERGQSSFRE